MDNFQKEALRLQEVCAHQIEHLFGDKVIFDNWTSELGYGRTGHCQGRLMEKAGVSVSVIQGDSLPPTASLRHPDLSAKSFKVTGLSVILHPYNPKIPTAHMNIRCFQVQKNSKEESYWFGGGFDLTPYFPNAQQIIRWHARTKNFLDGFDQSFYPLWKKDCDDYFYLKHRKEARGIGGIFFDDFVWDNQEKAASLVLSVATLFMELYFGFVKESKESTFTALEKDFQLWRRGRYVEFNLLQDRGTLFGLQSKGRIESILISLPPLTKWIYEGSLHFKEYNDRLNYFLKPRNWADIDAIELKLNKDIA
jgi:coproporphyrinogen III oxidase